MRLHHPDPGTKWHKGMVKNGEAWSDGTWTALAKKNHKLSFLHIFTAIQNETENVKMCFFFVFKSDSVSFWHPENLRPWTCALAGRRRVPRARGRRRRQRTCRGPWGCPSSCPSHRCRRMDLPVETDCQTYKNCYLVLTLVTCYCNLLYGCHLFVQRVKSQRNPQSFSFFPLLPDFSDLAGIVSPRFNCSDQMTYQTTAQIFMGLAQAWLPWNEIR